jgi:hypothetical protein
MSSIEEEREYKRSALVQTIITDIARAAKSPRDYQEFSASLTRSLVQDLYLPMFARSPEFERHVTQPISRFSDCTVEQRLVKALLLNKLCAGLVADVHAEYLRHKIVSMQTTA